MSKTSTRSDYAEVRKYAEGVFQALMFHSFFSSYELVHFKHT